MAGDVRTPELLTPSSKRVLASGLRAMSAFGDLPLIGIAGVLIFATVGVVFAVQRQDLTFLAVTVTSLLSPLVCAAVVSRALKRRGLIFADRSLAYSGIDARAVKSLFLRALLPFSWLCALPASGVVLALVLSARGRVDGAVWVSVPVWLAISVGFSLQSARGVGRPRTRWRDRVGFRRTS